MIRSFTALLAALGACLALTLTTAASASSHTPAVHAIAASVAPGGTWAVQNGATTDKITIGQNSGNWSIRAAAICLTGPEAFGSWKTSGSSYANCSSGLGFAFAQWGKNNPNQVTVWEQGSTQTHGSW